MFGLFLYRTCVVFRWLLYIHVGPWILAHTGSEEEFLCQERDLIAEIEEKEDIINKFILAKNNYKHLNS